MRTLYFAFISVLIGINAHSQIKISGKITDEHQNPLSDVQIQIGNQETFSNLNGNYELNSIEKGNYKIHIYLEGFNELIQEINLTQNQTLNFT
ncbi:MAG TPA: carboxypeptidase-like regulatory domain-containing protein, partial [Moheibacter sp.]|nr:carboxypeptidase-like regulatory domain-containing protein [Moheibacter sp.]